MDVREESKINFERDTANHKMTVLKDDGLYRHLRFKKEGNSCYWFDIITWPGCLTINGDMGTYTFARNEDMFGFFRTDKGEINPGYWAEKLLVGSGSGRDMAEQFDADKFERETKRIIVEWMRENRDFISKEDRRELWGNFQTDVLDEENERMLEAAYGFQFRFDAMHKNHEEDGPEEFQFQDLWEYNFKEWTTHYLWNLHAIVWAIKQYDQYKCEAAK